MISPARLALGLVLAAFPVLPLMLGGWVVLSTDVVRSAILLAELAAVGVWLASARGAVEVGRLPRAALALGGAWLAASAAATVAAVHVAPAVLRSAEWLGHGLFGLALWDEARRSDGLRWIVWSGLASFGLVVAALAALWVRLEDPAAFTWWTGIPLTGNVRRLGFHAVGAVVLAGALAVRARGPERAGALAVGAVAWGVLLWSGSRSSVLAALAAQVLLVSLAPARGRAAVAATLTLSSGVALALSFPVNDGTLGPWRLLPGYAAHVAEVGGEYGSGRLGIWRAALAAWAARPWLGLGPEGSAWLLHPTPQEQPHSVVVQALVEWGVLGALPFGLGLMAAFVAAVRGATRACDAAPRAARAAGAAGLAAAGLGGQLDGWFYNPQTMLFVAAALALASTPSGAARASGHRLPRTALAGLALVLAVLFAGHLAVVRAVWAPGVPAPQSTRARLVQAVPVASVVGPTVDWARAWHATEPAAAHALAAWGERHARHPWRFVALDGDLHAAAGDTAAAHARYRAAARLERRLARAAPRD